MKAKSELDKPEIYYVFLLLSSDVILQKELPVILILLTMV